MGTISEEPEVDSGEKVKRIAIAKRLVKYVLGNTVIFHDKFQDGYIKCTNSPPAIYKMRGRDFKKWLSKVSYDVEDQVPGAESLNAAINVLEGKACFNAPMFELHNRVAPDPEGDGFWYDMSNEANQAVHITKGGWEIVDHPPILFKRYKHQLPQTLPQRNGDPRLFLSFVNIKGEDKDLKLVDIHTKFVPEIPHTIWILYGPQGAAKTTAMETERSIVDPSTMKTLVLHHNQKELAQQLEHNYCAYYDNVSSDKKGETSLPYWVSDMLSRAATGAGFPKRELYSDDEDVFFDFLRCVGLNGINLAATRPDVLDRAILTEVDAIQPKDRKSIKLLRSAFEKEKGRILGGIFDVLVKAIRIYPTIKFKSLPRMADYAMWACAIAEALELGKENKEKCIAEAKNPEEKKVAEEMKTGAHRFLELYAKNVERQVEEATKSSIVASVLLSFLVDIEGSGLGLPMDKDGRKCVFDGTANNLLDKLEEFAEAHRIKIKDETFPKTANTLSRKLNDIKTNLFALNYELIKTREHAGRSLKINKIMTSPVELGENIVTIDTSTQPATNQASPGDDGKNRIDTIVTHTDTPPAGDDNRDDKKNIDTPTDTPRPTSTQARDDGDDSDDISSLLTGTSLIQAPETTPDKEKIDISLFSQGVNKEIDPQFLTKFEAYMEREKSVGLTRATKDLGIQEDLLAHLVSRSGKITWSRHGVLAWSPVKLPRGEKLIADCRKCGSKTTIHVPLEQLTATIRCVRCGEEYKFSKLKIHCSVPNCNSTYTDWFLEGMAIGNHRCALCKTSGFLEVMREN